MSVFMYNVKYIEIFLLNYSVCRLNMKKEFMLGLDETNIKTQDQ